MSLINENNLADVRQFYRLSCEEFGALMDVSGRFVSYVERGARNLPDSRAKQLERELSLTPQKLTQILGHVEKKRSSAYPAAEYAKLAIALV